MAVGDMKYKFTDKAGAEQEVEIPAEVLRKGKRAGKTNRQTILEYAADQGFDVDVPQVASKKKTSKRTRKPNKTKADLIDRLSAAMSDVGEVNIVNPERQVQVVIDGTVFEFTLVQKRAPKQ
jgi:hypothetical protein